MSIQLENEPDLDNAFFQHNLPQYYRVILRQFRKVTHSFVSFNLLFLAVFVLELSLFFSFLPVLGKSIGLGVALSGIFLTCFSYFLLLFYFQAKKPEQLTQLRNQFLESCRQILPCPPGDVQHHLSLAAALSKLAIYLQDFECNFYKLPRIFAPFSSLISRFSSYCYWEDVFNMKIDLLKTALDEHLLQLRVTPTDLEVHASLANTYIALSKVYQSIPSQRNQSHFEEKSRSAGRLAIEEFRILSHYAPNDPWIHEQLAIGYHDLGMPEEETKEIETLLTLRPNDKEILFRLGILYFHQGQNAKGLQVYDELKKANFKRAEELLYSYGRIQKPLS